MTASIRALATLVALTALAMGAGFIGPAQAQEGTLTKIESGVPGCLASSWFGASVSNCGLLAVHWDRRMPFEPSR
jgi:hypothetical protein